MGIPPHLSFLTRDVGSYMLVQIHRKLGAVNADEEGWEEQVREHIETGSNFLLLLPKDQEAVNRFCHLFELEDNCKPRILKQGEFFLLSQFIEPEAFDKVLAEWDDNHQVVFVEQIDFAINRPPRLKPFLVYSPVLGIIAQHERQSDARDDLDDYEDNSLGNGVMPEAGVYIWEKNHWVLFEGR